MGSPRPARLYQKKTGIFFVRVLLAKTEKAKNRPELRRSLQTKDVTSARSLSSSLNALLEFVPTQLRTAAVNDFFAHSVATWTLPGGIEAHGEDDQRRLSQFLKAHPVIEQAIAQRIANLAWTPPAPSAASLTASPEGRTGPQTVPTGSILPSNTPFAASHPRVAGPTNLPRQPLRLSAGRA